MDEIRLVLLGFGSANRALVRALLEKSESLYSSCNDPAGKSPRDQSPRFLRVPVAEKLTEGALDESATRLVRWRVVSIVTRRHGRICVPIQDEEVHFTANREEIDVNEALRRVESGGMLDDSLLLRSCVHFPLQSTEVPVENRCEKRYTYNTVSNLAQEDEFNLEIQQLLSRLGRTGTANVLVEAIPSNPKNGEPAISFITAAIKSKLHVVSANKGPLAYRIPPLMTGGSDICLPKGNLENEEAYIVLKKLARENNVLYLHESAVMDGVPVFSLWQYTLPQARLKSLRGCLNSTTTVIITRMEGSLAQQVQNESMTETSKINTGESFEEALKAAKCMGIVEEDDSLDVDGYDAALKLRALLVVLSSSSSKQIISVPAMDDIPRDSIRDVTREDIGRAYLDGKKKYRLVASAELVQLSGMGRLPSSSAESNLQNDDRTKSTSQQSNKISLTNANPSTALLTHSQPETFTWDARVKLELISPSDPLYNLSGTSSSIQFCTNVLGPITVVSTDPTLVDTAYGLFSDILRVASKSK